MHTRDRYAIIWCKFLTGADGSDLDMAGGRELRIGDVVPVFRRWRDCGFASFCISIRLAVKIDFFFFFFLNGEDLCGEVLVLHLNLGFFLGIGSITFAPNFIFSTKSNLRAKTEQFWYNQGFPSCAQPLGWEPDVLSHSGAQRWQGAGSAQWVGSWQEYVLQRSGKHRVWALSEPLLVWFFFSFKHCS